VAFFVWNQVEGGHGCPISMTYAAIPAIRMNDRLAAFWEPLLAARTYDPLLMPASRKGSALCGMAMTEKQGGSDVRANTNARTTARRRRIRRALCDHRAQMVLFGAHV